MILELNDRMVIELETEKLGPLAIGSLGHAIYDLSIKHKDFQKLLPDYIIRAVLSLTAYYRDALKDNGELDEGRRIVPDDAKLFSQREIEEFASKYIEKIGAKSKEFDSAGTRYRLESLAGIEELPERDGENDIDYFCKIVSIAVKTRNELDKKMMQNMLGGLYPKSVLESINRTMSLSNSMGESLSASRRMIDQARDFPKLRDPFETTNKYLSDIRRIQGEASELLRSLSETVVEIYGDLKRSSRNTMRIAAGTLIVTVLSLGYSCYTSIQANEESRQMAESVKEMSHAMKAFLDSQTRSDQSLKNAISEIVRQQQEVAGHTEKNSSSGSVTSSPP